MSDDFAMRQWPSNKSKKDRNQNPTQKMAVDYTYTEKSE